MSWARSLQMLALLLPGTMTASRIYVPVEVQRVPLARLSANLRRAMRDEPRKALWVHNLARAHAMAWATRTEQLPVAAHRRSPYEPPNLDSAARNATEVWFGREADYVPFKSTIDAVEGKRLPFVRAHLDTALVLYGQAIALDSTDLTIRLGQAWLLSQTPERRSAIPRLRAIVRELSTADARNPNRVPFSASTLMAEAAGTSSRCSIQPETRRRSTPFSEEFERKSAAHASSHPLWFR